MGAKEFKAIGGLANNETTQNIITQAITTNSATTIDTVALNSFYSIRYDIAIKQGSKIRTSTVSVQTDGTSVDSTEYGIVATGGAISGVAITATTSGSNMLLQVTITDAATTIARVRASRNLLGVIQPYAPSAPTIGTATAGAEQATVTFTAPVDNGNTAITSYIATSSPGGITGSSASSPVTVFGLTGSVAYTFTVAATNGYGTSPSSAASNSVTPTIIPARAGFWMGGQIGAPTYAYVTAIDKVLFSNDSKSTLSTSLSVGTSWFEGFANSGTAGYAGGGQNSGVSYTSRVFKTPFTTETTATTTSMTDARKYFTGCANSGTAGYWFGGEISGIGGPYASGVKILFSNDSTSAIANAGTSARKYSAGFANSGTAGYWAGGSNSTSTASNLVQKITFSNDSTSNLSASGYLSVAKLQVGGFSNSGVAGYVYGGYSAGNYYTSIDKIAYSNETRSLLAATVTNSVAGAGCANSGTAGYLAARKDSGESNVIDKLLFSNDTKSTLAATLTNSIRSNTSFANSGIL